MIRQGVQPQRLFASQLWTAVDLAQVQTLNRPVCSGYTPSVWNSVFRNVYHQSEFHHFYAQCYLMKRFETDWNWACNPKAMPLVKNALRAPLKMRFLCGSIVADVLADPKHSFRSRGQLSSCMAYTLRCCVRRRLTTTEKSLFLEAPLSDSHRIGFRSSR